MHNYLPFIKESMIIKDFNEAISNNYCIARKSTILLEALYNNSLSYALLPDKQDKLILKMFFLLWDERIKKIYTFNELKNINTFSTRN